MKNEKYKTTNEIHYFQNHFPQNVLCTSIVAQTIFLPLSCASYHRVTPGLSRAVKTAVNMIKSCMQHLLYSRPAWLLCRFRLVCCFLDDSIDCVSSQYEPCFMIFNYCRFSLERNFLGWLRVPALLVAGNTMRPSFIPALLLVCDRIMCKTTPIFLYPCVWAWARL